jgi:HAD superfamily hydrolase (TIGR01549 family)
MLARPGTLRAESHNSAALATMALVAPIALFDLDGTLVDRQRAFRRWAERFADIRGLGTEAVEWLCQADDDGFRQRRDLFESALDRFDLDDSLDELLGEYWVDYISFYGPDPEVNEALKRLRSAGWRLGVVTNGAVTQHEKMSRAELTDLVDACCVSEEVGVAKPDRRIFEEAFRRCGCLVGGPDAAWMIGDTAEPDIGGGRGVDMRTAWIHRGRQWEVPDYRPDVEVGSVPDAVEVLLAW